MKFCESCGNKLGEKELYCSKCGKKQSNVKTTKKEKESEVKQTTSDGKVVAGIVLGIVSIVLAFTFFLSPIAIIISIVGIVLAAKAKEKSGSKTAGLVLNIVGLVMSILTVFSLMFLIGIFAFIDEVDNSNGFDYVEDSINDNIQAPSIDEIAGTWNCKKMDQITGDYTAKLQLNSDYTFMFSRYNDTTSDYVKGYYEIDYDTYSNKYGYALELDGEEVVENGQRQIHKDYDYDFVVSKITDSVRGILTSSDTETVYYCDNK